MRLSQFRILLDDEFGEAYAATLARSHALHALGSQTAEEALADGVPPRTVWLALCEDMGVPEERRLGLDRRPQAPGPD
ncbi:MAG: DUF3046 domain-containing protein [Nostocoides sp.]